MSNSTLSLYAPQAYFGANTTKWKTYSEYFLLHCCCLTECLRLIRNVCSGVDTGTSALS